MTEIVAIIATTGRSSPVRIALKSVLQQSLRPSRIIVVGEINEDLDAINEMVSNSSVEIVPLINKRTRNLSGALNTALFHLLSLGVDEEDTLVAFLDDDDRWDMNYLENVTGCIESDCSDLVVSGIIRHETEGDSLGRKQSIPPQLTSSSFLTTNPHIQGSNLFIRLSCLLRAGGFDENLKSTTDRDLGIRLFDLGNLKASYLNKHLVHHYATDNNRISSFGSPRKRSGLFEFYNKYSSRMNPTEKTQFKKRATELFGCSDSDFTCDEEELKKEEPARRPTPPSITESIDFMVGLTSSQVISARLLLQDLDLVFPAFAGRKKLVICDNLDNAKELEETIKSMRSEIQIRFINKETIEKVASNGKFGKYYEAPSRRKGIAYGRTVLHHYLYLESRDLTHPVVWVLDDDVRLDRIFLENSQLGPSEFAAYVAGLDSQGCSIAIGKIAGDAPLPAGSMIRTELLDFLFNLQALASHPDSQGSTLQGGQRNAQVMKQFPDYYYDMSLRHGGHLETPMWYEPKLESYDTMDALESILQEFPLICTGVNPFRPIPLSSAIGETTENSMPVRGGNTLIFDTECLRTFPNIAPISEGATFRRGDTVWAILNQEIGRRKIWTRKKKVISIPLHVRQDRGNSTKSDIRMQTVFNDVYGASFVRVLKDHLSSKRRLDGRYSTNELLQFSPNEIQQLVSDFDRRVNQRLEILRMNSWRIRGLVDSIRNLLQNVMDRDGRVAEIVRGHYSTVQGVLQIIEKEYSEDRINECIKSYQNARIELESFLTNLEDYCISYREKLPARCTPSEMEDVKRFLQREFQAKDLILIGEGSEGLVFTDGVRAYKHFHDGIEHFGQGQLELLKEFLESHRTLKHIPSIEEIAITEGRVVIVSSFVDGKQYRGGHLNNILDLLRECREAGICLTNICPQNLLVKGPDLMYIDLGNSIVEFSEQFFDQMCRRAYLTYRWHFRKDLKDLLSKSLRNRDLPELFGFDYFRAALDVKDTHEIIDPELISLVERSEANEILDYGCGSGSVSDQLAKLGKRVFAYDIDSREFFSKGLHPPGVTFLERNNLDRIIESGRTFDCVICNLVICTIENDDEVLRVLKECRKLVSVDGTIFLGICNPFDIFTRESTTHFKELSEPANYYSKFVFKKQSKETGRWREDVHRTLDWYRSAFGKAGIEIEELSEIPSVDVSLLSPSSDFMLMKLRPTTIKQSNVSLLIKVGAMECRSVRKQVEHIVKQLEGPQRFLERIVVTDTFEGPFVRQYDSGNFEKLRAELDFLLKNGTIDQYFVATSDKESIASISSKWFGLRAESLRSRNGQPALTILYGFDKCKGHYIFQIDSDCLIGRRDKNHDYLEEMLKVFSQDELAVAISLPIAESENKPFTTHGEHGKWRTEQRCALISKSRLAKLLPLPNSVDENGILEHAWHRSLDIALNLTSLQSYRGGSSNTFFIHVQNDRKKDINAWYNIMKALEAGRMYQDQVGKVDLVGSVEQWLTPRKDPMIFVLRGRNVPIPKVRRCVDSLKMQKTGDWGIILIDAASDNGSEEFIENVVLRNLGDKVTMYRNLKPISPMENTYTAVSKLCNNLESIIVLVDLDDALIGNRIIETLDDVYQKGADVTVGTMLRTDKSAEYPVDFDNPRKNRGGNVWQHLRTFKKYLFDQVSLEDLKVDGSWVPHTEDWAFMLPIVELSENPVHVTVPLYFFEPSIRTFSPEEREDIISKIVSKKSYKAN